MQDPKAFPFTEKTETFLNPIKLNPTRLKCTSKNNFESQRDIMGFTLRKEGSDFFFYELILSFT